MPLEKCYATSLDCLTTITVSSLAACGVRNRETTIRQTEAYLYAPTDLQRPIDRWDKSGADGVGQMEKVDDGAEVGQTNSG